MAIDGVVIKVKIPRSVHEALLEESRDKGVTKAALVRMAVADRYSVGVRDDDPVPMVLTESGREQVNNGS